MWIYFTIMTSRYQPNQIANVVKMLNSRADRFPLPGCKLPLRVPPETQGAAPQARSQVPALAQREIQTNHIPDDVFG